MADSKREAMAAVERTARLTTDTGGSLYGQNFLGTGSSDATSFPRRPNQTGFTANQRPAIYYKPSLDCIDNPQFGLLLSDSFMSETKQHYRTHVRGGSSAALPNLINRHGDSGFHQLRNHQKRGAAVEKTQQTCASVTKNDFSPTSFMQGAEATPNLRSRSCRETGFSRDAIAPLTRPTPPPLPPPLYKTNDHTVKIIGKKEPSGFLLNAPNSQVFPSAPFDFSHFTTHYKSDFSHKADAKSWRSPAGILRKMDDGYNCRDTDRFIIKG